MYSFDPVKTKDECVRWIQDWFSVNGADCKAVIGISGGKDSSVCAALCVAALGRERVMGVLMPNGTQHDIDVSHRVVEFLGIQSCTVNIKEPYDAMLQAVMVAVNTPSRQTIINLAPRLRMTTLYAVSQSVNGRVANTCNLSEDWVGYSTRWGDATGDFSPLSLLTVQEVKAIGHALGLPYDIVEKVPIDGLCGFTDEDNLGFSYKALDLYIREGICDDGEVKSKIDRLHRQNAFKLQPIPTFDPAIG